MTIKYKDRTYDAVRNQVNAKLLVYQTRRDELQTLLLTAGETPDDDLSYNILVSDPLTFNRNTGTL